MASKAPLGHSTPNCQCYLPFPCILEKLPKLMSHLKTQAKVTRPSWLVRMSPGVVVAVVVISSWGNRCSQVKTKLERGDDGGGGSPKGFPWSWAGFATLKEL